MNERARRARTARRGLAAPALVIGFLIALGVGAPVASADDGVSLSAQVATRDVSRTSDRHPAVLDPDQPTIVEITVTNQGPAPIHIRTVRLSGQAIGLTFFAHETTLELDVEPGATATRTFEVDLSALRGQASGLLPGAVSILDARRHSVASTSAVWDVKGRFNSVYGLFGFAVLVFTAVSAAGALLDLARQRLNPNRWRRGLRFLTPGIGAGLVIVFTLSALRVFAPARAVWLPFVTVGAIAGFAAGYLMPPPAAEPLDEDDEDDDRWIPVQTLPLDERTIDNALFGTAAATIVPDPRATPPLSEGDRDPTDTATTLLGEPPTYLAPPSGPQAALQPTPPPPVAHHFEREPRA